MGTKLGKALIPVLVLLTFIPFRGASADVGPKPTMNFNFVQGFPGLPLNITSGTLYECEQPDCQDATPLEELGPQGFDCQATSCSALGYGFSTYQQLEIQFSDGKTRRSNVFENVDFNANYKVTIREDDLLVEPLSGSVVNLDIRGLTLYLALGAGCLCVIVVGAVAVFLIVWRLAKKK
jgi:hypothetical protein